MIIKHLKKNAETTFFKYLGLLLLSVSMFISCKPHIARLSDSQNKRVKDSISSMAINITRDISSQGPAAWLNYFEDTPDFFMVSNGELAFRDYKSAKEFILNKLVKNIPHIKLHLTNERIDALSSDLASIGADFREELTDKNGKTLNFEGYFSAIVHLTDHGWKLRNVQWSIKAPDKGAN